MSRWVREAEGGARQVGGRVTAAAGVTHWALFPAHVGTLQREAWSHLALNVERDTLPAQKKKYATWD